MNPLILIGGVYFFASVLLGLCGRHRKLGGWGYFFASLLLTPVFGLLLVLASTRVPARQNPARVPVRVPLKALPAAAAPIAVRSPRFLPRLFRR